MNFSDWFFQESTINDLYQSTVNSFDTKKRQYATDTIKITNLEWIPYQGVKTLYVKALAQNEGREYNPIIMFKNIKYATPNGLLLAANDGKAYRVEPISMKENDVLTRCQCADFHWRGQHANALDHSLFGRDRKKYESLGVRQPVNPNNAPFLCKHLMKMVKVIKETKILID